MATHSSTLAWKIPWTEEPRGLLAMGSLRVRHDWLSNVTFTFHFPALEKEMATHSSVLARKSNGWRSLAGYHPYNHRVRLDWATQRTRTHALLAKALLYSNLFRRRSGGGLENRSDSHSDFFLQYNVPFLLFHWRDRIYFSISWIWTCLGSGLSPCIVIDMKLFSLSLRRHYNVCFCLLP